MCLRQILSEYDQAPIDFHTIICYIYITTTDIVWQS